MVGHIPEETTSFVGRTAELVRLEQALTHHRLVTLTGTGGVGKTRLALRAARRIAARYPDGVWWADLAPLDGDRLLLATVSDAVDLSDHSPRMPVEALCEWLAGKRLLLVLDSCEYLIDACRSLVGELLAAAPGLTVLATGRQPLRLAAERQIEVGPMTADGPDALALFTERAAALAPGYPFTGPAAAAAARICRRLEGIPLALELAAAQVGHSTVEEVSRRLTSRFDVLVHSERVWPERHRTMRTAIGWSHELCAPAERLLWARLTVFRSAFDPASARSVCAGGPLDADGIGPALEGLVTKSVLSRDGDRYRMLDTIREYGRLWLAALGEEDAVADRHAEHFLDLARQADAGWLSPDQLAWYRRVGEAHTDLCTALDRLLTTAPRRALELAAVVGFFWSCCGRLREARSYLEHALAEYPVPGPERARALWALGVTVSLQGEYDTAHRLSEECEVVARQDGDREMILAAAYLAGLLALLTGRPVDARLVTDQVLTELPGGPFDSASRLRCHLVAVFALTALGKPAEARAEAERLRAGCVARGECWTRAYIDHQLALIALSTGRPWDAADHARAMLIGKREMRDSFGIALGLDVLAAALAAQGDGERAALVYGIGLAHWATVGHPQRGTPQLRAVREELERSARATAGDRAYESAFLRGATGDTEVALAEALRPGPAVGH
ncbi:ATP-binding protein [Streptomyces sp. NPDC018031]|uniref:ATP-binding protein n=1 Tax=Streptomyces sp. NPDC018031 TaxID=3365033 RepID=UPI0037B1EEFB